MARAKVRPNFKRPRTGYFFRHWRKHRGYTQAELAEIVGVSVATISQLETGRVGFSDDTLEGLAAALHCGPGDLLMRNPLDEDAVWSIWDHIPKEKRTQALKVLSAFADEEPAKMDGTNG